VERLEARILGELPELPPSPGAELLIYLLARPGWREGDELEKVVGDLEAALERLRQSEYGRYLDEEDGRYRLNARSDVVEFWEDAFRDWEKTAARYGELAPGFDSQIPAFRDWLAEERRALLHALWGTAIGRAGAMVDQGAAEAAVALLRGVEEAYPYEAAAALDLADVYWRARRPADTARVIEAVMDRVPEEQRPRARLNLAAALLRAGQTERALEMLKVLEAEGGPVGSWAAIHRGSYAALSGDPKTALRLAEEAYRAAEETTDGELAIAALMLKGEALTRMGKPKDATHALGEALGIHEIMRRSFSPLTLALLAEAHARWGYGDKARELAEKAFKDARLQQDPYAASRALWALGLATGEDRYRELALAEAEKAGHVPWKQYLERAE
jgi:predicted negative regulator of RcsB-dependent stress response